MISYLKSKYQVITGSIERLSNQTTFYLGDNLSLTKLFTGQYMYVDTRDTSVVPHLMISGSWEPEITKVWQSLAKSSSVIFDVGANFGYYGVIASKDHESGNPQVHMFEANPNLSSLMSRTCSINGLASSTKINQIAVSDRKTQYEFTIYRDYFGGSRINNAGDKDSEDFAIKEKIKVESISLDDYIKENKIGAVDLIKIDVEGHEDKVYKGLQKTIKANKDLKIFLEFTDGQYDDSEKLFNQMKTDFKYVYAIKGRDLLALKSYKELQKQAGNDWIMLVLSNSEIIL